MSVRLVERVFLAQYIFYGVAFVIHPQNRFTQWLAHTNNATRQTRPACIIEKMALDDLELAKRHDTLVRQRRIKVASYFGYEEKQLKSPRLRGYERIGRDDNTRSAMRHLVNGMGEHLPQTEDAKVQGQTL